MRKMINWYDRTLTRVDRWVERMNYQGRHWAPEVWTI